LPYAVLTDLVSVSNNPLAVLDLACGEGHAFMDAAAPLQAGDGLIATGWGLRAVRARAA
jgi:hypothetical protein